MKKALSAVLVIVFAAALLCSCGAKVKSRMSLDFDETFGDFKAFSVKDLAIEYFVTFKENEEYDMGYDFEKFEKDFKEKAKSAADYAEKSEQYNKLIDEYIKDLKADANKSGKYFKNGDHLAIIDGTPVFNFRLENDSLILITENKTEYTLERQ